MRSPLNLLTFACPTSDYFFLANIYLTIWGYYLLISGEWHNNTSRLCTFRPIMKTLNLLLYLLFGLHLTSLKHSNRCTELTLDFVKFLSHLLDTLVFLLKAINAIVGQCTFNIEHSFLLLLLHCFDIYELCWTVIFRSYNCSFSVSSASNFRQKLFWTLIQEWLGRAGFRTVITKFSTNFTELAWREWYRVFSGPKLCILFSWVCNLINYAFNYNLLGNGFICHNDIIHILQQFKRIWIVAFCPPLHEVVHYVRGFFPLKLQILSLFHA